ARREEGHRAPRGQEGRRAQGAREEGHQEGQGGPEGRQGRELHGVRKMTQASHGSQARKGGRRTRGGRLPNALRASAVAALFLVAVAPASATSSPAVGVSSVVATAKVHSVAIYRSPHAKRPFRHMASPNADGVRLTFLVKSRTTGWEQVYLPMRPNGSTGWVRDSQVDLANDPYRVEVSLRKHRVTVWKGLDLVWSEPAGVGRSVMPTPRGRYYLVELLKQPDPNGLYGPYAFALSAFSNVFEHFGGGPGEIGLHGTNDPARLGTDVSHGCIRISNTGIAKLAAMLPLGT